MIYEPLRRVNESVRICAENVGGLRWVQPAVPPRPITDAAFRGLASDKSTPADGMPIEEHTADHPLVAAGTGLCDCLPATQRHPSFPCPT